MKPREPVPGAPDVYALRINKLHAPSIYDRRLARIYM